MKKAVFIILSIFYTFSAYSQIKPKDIRIGTFAERNYGFMPNIGADFYLKNRSDIRLGVGYNPGSYSTYNRHRLGYVSLGHIYTLKYSKKFNNLKTWYIGQSLEYGFNINESKNSDYRVTNQRLNFELSIGRQFNLSPKVSLFAEYSFTGSLYENYYAPINSNSGRATRSESYLGSDYNRMNGGRFEIGLIYRFLPSSKFK